MSPKTGLSFFLRVPQDPRASGPEVVGSNPTPATSYYILGPSVLLGPFHFEALSLAYEPENRAVVFLASPATGYAGTSNFTVQVQDSATPAQMATANLSITLGGALAITTTGLPNGVQNASYGASVAATGGVGPYSFSITRGAPPSGITMNTSGVFAGTSSFTVQVTDVSSPKQTAKARLSLIIVNSLAITTTS
jgi:hypothetical protein